RLEEVDGERLTRLGFGSRLLPVFGLARAHHVHARIGLFSDGQVVPEVHRRVITSGAPRGPCRSLTSGEPCQAGAVPGAEFPKIEHFPTALARRQGSSPDPFRKT